MLHPLSDYYIIQKNFLYLHLYVAMVDHFGHFPSYENKISKANIIFFLNNAIIILINIRVVPVETVPYKLHLNNISKNSLISSKFIFHFSSWHHAKGLLYSTWIDSRVLVAWLFLWFFFLKLYILYSNNSKRTYSIKLIINQFYICKFIFSFWMFYDRKIITLIKYFYNFIFKSTMYY